MTSPSSDVQIANIALSRIGHTQIITSFDPTGGTATDGSLASQQVSVHWVHARDELLRSFPWPWASKEATLVQVSAVGVRATQEWLFSYRYPSDALAIRKLFPTINETSVGTPPALVSQPEPWRKPEGDAMPWSFSTGSDAQGRLIYTDLENAICKYTAQITDTTLWPHDFADLFTWKLAVDLSYGLAISDSRRETAIKMFEHLEQRVRAVAFNESQSDIPHITTQAEAVQARFGLK
jgi:hypothetical protein